MKLSISHPQGLQASLANLGDRIHWPSYRSKSLRMEMYEAESYVHGHHIVSGFEKKLSFVRERSGILRICMLYGRDV